MFNSKDDIKNWILNYIEKSSKASLRTAIKNSTQIKNEIIKYTNFLPNDVKMNQRCYHIIEDLLFIPKCMECDNNVNFSNLNKEWKYNKYCSVKCSNNSDIKKKKYADTCIEKYGVDNFSKSDIFKNNIITINKEKYGVDWYMQCDDFRVKSISTCLKKYGFDSYTKTNEFKNRLRKTFQDKYGVDWYTKSIEFKNKLKSIFIEKYNCDHPMKNKEFKENFFNNIFNKYGVKYLFETEEFKENSKIVKKKLYGDENYNNRDKYKETSSAIYGQLHPMKCDSVKEKVKFTNNKRYGVDWYTLTDDCKEKSILSKYNNNCFSYKKYTLPSGSVVYIQGYENFTLDILLINFIESDVIISNKEIKEEIGILNYFIDKKQSIYLPDIYIKSINKVIEVKSEYTYNLDIEKNKLKKQCCLMSGIGFEFWVFDKKGNLLYKK
jgi:hypothetical protein